MLTFLLFAKSVFDRVSIFVLLLRCRSRLDAAAFDRYMGFEMLVLLSVIHSNTVGKLPWRGYLIRGLCSAFR